MSSKRLQWIDVAKGILILLVVLGHFYGISKALGIDHPGIKAIGGGNFLFTSFYMGAFFVLTGYTTNFKKKFLPFLVSSVKALVLPAFCFSLISLLLLSFLFQDLSYIKSVVGTEYWYSGFKFYWFLNALFLSRICYWLLYNYLSSEVVIGALLFGLLLGGIYLSSLYKDVPGSPISHNPLFVHHFMRMAFYLWIGQMFKKFEFFLKTKYLLMGGGNFYYGVTVL